MCVCVSLGGCVLCSTAVRHMTGSSACDDHVFGASSELQKHQQPAAVCPTECWDRKMPSGDIFLSGATCLQPLVEDVCPAHNQEGVPKLVPSI